MTANNLPGSVIELDQERNKRRLKKTQSEYLNYLSELTSMQLEYEVNFLLEEYSTHDFNDDFFLRGKLILQEIMKRTTGSWKDKIKEMNEALFKQIESTQL